MTARTYLVIDDNLAFAENVAEVLCDVGARVDMAVLAKPQPVPQLLQVLTSACRCDVPGADLRPA